MSAENTGRSASRFTVSAVVDTSQSQAQDETPAPHSSGGVSPRALKARLAGLQAFQDDGTAEANPANGNCAVGSSEESAANSNALTWGSEHGGASRDDVSGSGARSAGGGQYSHGVGSANSGSRENTVHRKGRFNVSDVSAPNSATDSVENVSGAAPKQPAAPQVLTGRTRKFTVRMVEEPGKQGTPPAHSPEAQPPTGDGDHTQSAEQQQQQQQQTSGSQAELTRVAAAAPHHDPHPLTQLSLTRGSSRLNPNAQRSQTVPKAQAAQAVGRFHVRQPSADSVDRTHLSPVNAVDGTQARDRLSVDHSMSRVSSVQDDSNIHSPATPMNSLVGIKVNVPAAMNKETVRSSLSGEGPQLKESSAQSRRYRRGRFEVNDIYPKERPTTPDQHVYTTTLAAAQSVSVDRRSDQHGYEPPEAESPTFYTPAASVSGQGIGQEASMQPGAAGGYYTVQPVMEAQHFQPTVVQDAYGQQYQLAEAPAHISYVPVVPVSGGQYEGMAPQFVPVTYASVSAPGGEGGGSVSGPGSQQYVLAAAPQYAYTAGPAGSGESDQAYGHHANVQGLTSMVSNASPQQYFLASEGISPGDGYTYATVPVPSTTVLPSGETAVLSHADGTPMLAAQYTTAVPVHTDASGMEWQTAQLPAGAAVFVSAPDAQGDGQPAYLLSQPLAALPNGSVMTMDAMGNVYATTPAEAQGYLVSTGEDQYALYQQQPAGTEYVVAAAAPEQLQPGEYAYAQPTTIMQVNAQGELEHPQLEHRPSLVLVPQGTSLVATSDMMQQPVSAQLIHPLSGETVPAQLIHPLSGEAVPAQLINPLSGETMQAQIIHPVTTAEGTMYATTDGVPQQQLYAEAEPRMSGQYEQQVLVAQRPSVESIVYPLAQLQLGSDGNYYQSVPVTVAPEQLHYVDGQGQLQPLPEGTYMQAGPSFVQQEQPAGVVYDAQGQPQQAMYALTGSVAAPQQHMAFVTAAPQQQVAFVPAETAMYQQQAPLQQQQQAYEVSSQYGHPSGYREGEPQQLQQYGDAYATTTAQVPADYGDGGVQYAQAAAGQYYEQQHASVDGGGAQYYPMQAQDGGGPYFAQAPPADASYQYQLPPPASATTGVAAEEGTATAQHLLGAGSASSRGGTPTKSNASRQASLSPGEHIPASRSSSQGSRPVGRQDSSGLPTGGRLRAWRAAEDRVNLIQKQNNNLSKMLSTLSEVYNPPGEHTELFSRLIKDLVDIRMKVIKLGRDNQQLRQEQQRLLTLLEEDDRRRGEPGHTPAHSVELPVPTAENPSSGEIETEEAPLDQVGTMGSGIAVPTDPTVLVHVSPRLRTASHPSIRRTSAWNALQRTARPLLPSVQVRPAFTPRAQQSRQRPVLLVRPKRTPPRTSWPGGQVPSIPATRAGVWVLQSPGSGPQQYAAPQPEAQPDQRPRPSNTWGSRPANMPNNFKEEEHYEQYSRAYREAMYEEAVPEDGEGGDGVNNESSLLLEEHADG